MCIRDRVKNLDKNKYHSNVIHWKQFLAAGKDESIAAEPYDPVSYTHLVATIWRRLLLLSG